MKSHVLLFHNKRSVEFFLGTHFALKRWPYSMEDTLLLEKTKRRKRCFLGRTKLALGAGIVSQCSQLEQWHILYTLKLFDLTQKSIDEQ